VTTPTTTNPARLWAYTRRHWRGALDGALTEHEPLFAFREEDDAREHRARVAFGAVGPQTDLAEYVLAAVADDVARGWEGAFHACEGEAVLIRGERDDLRAEVAALRTEGEALRGRVAALRAFAEGVVEKVRFERVEGRELFDLAYKAACTDEWAARPFVFGKVFADAGLPATLTAIPNRYWPTSYDEASDPWFVAQTELGPITIGWRKRVLSIDWSAWPSPPDGRTIFVREQDGDFEGRTTVWESGVHAWSYEKATEYLRRLREAALARTWTDADRPPPHDVARADRVNVADEANAALRQDWSARAIRERKALRLINSALSSLPTGAGTKALRDVERVLMGLGEEG